LTAASLDGRLDTILKAAILESWSEFLMVGCPSSHQPTGIGEETLEYGGSHQQQISASLPHFLSQIKLDFDHI
jgi:hypothetical protein